MSHLGRLALLKRILMWGSLLLLAKVLASILSNYWDYFPPNFDSDFLIGREGHFYGFYSIAFYSHIISTPIALVSGSLLMNQAFRGRYPALHKRIGKLHLVGLLLVLAPSSLVMSVYAQGGLVAGLGFASLALATCLFAMMGWRHAVSSDFKRHRYWMTRCFWMLCSAIILRLISGTATLIQLDSDWTYPIAAWSSWILPLIGLEVFEKLKLRCKS